MGHFFGVLIILLSCITAFGSRSEASSSALRCSGVYGASTQLSSYMINYHNELSISPAYYQNRDHARFQQLATLPRYLNANSKQALAQVLAENDLSGYQNQIKHISAAELQLIQERPLPSNPLFGQGRERHVYFVDLPLDTLLPSKKLELLNKLKAYVGPGSILIFTSNVHSNKSQDIDSDLKYLRQPEQLDFLARPLSDLGLMEYGEIQIHWDWIAFSYVARYVVTRNIPAGLPYSHLYVGDSIMLLHLNYFEKEKIQHLLRQSGYKNIQFYNSLGSKTAFILAEVVSSQ